MPPRTFEEKIKTLPELVAICDELRAEGQQIVQCHGVFDLVHPGHVRHFEAARAEGDVLVVTVTPDRFVNKGPGRPVFNQRLRAEIGGGARQRGLRRGHRVALRRGRDPPDPPRGVREGQRLRRREGRPHRQDRSTSGARWRRGAGGSTSPPRSPSARATSSTCTSTSIPEEAQELPARVPPAPLRRRGDRPPQGPEAPQGAGRRRDDHRRVPLRAVDAEVAQGAAGRHPLPAGGALRGRHPRLRQPRGRASAARWTW